MNRFEGGGNWEVAAEDTVRNYEKDNISGGWRRIHNNVQLF
jgi:hypothetical protein